MTVVNSLNKEKRTVQRDYSSSNMSDTKWRALFSAVETAKLVDLQIVIKFVDVLEQKRMRLPSIQAPQLLLIALSMDHFHLFRLSGSNFHIPQ
jgi:hypothetical protein